MRNELVKEISSRARKIMEKHYNELGSVFDNYPSGACGNTSDMLALYMEKNGINGIEYVSGQREQRSHGWLEIDGYIVDITSDQFSDGLGPVYVGENNEFHSSFTNQSRSSPSISNCLIDSYNKFERLMNENV